MKKKHKDSGIPSNMLYERVNDSPVLGSKDFLQFDQPIIANENNEWTWMEYYGSGVDISNHPLKDRCNMHGCAECKSENVKVIYGKWCVSTHSGDAYYDYEIICEDCGRFTARSYNEND